MKWSEEILLCYLLEILLAFGYVPHFFSYDHNRGGRNKANNRGRRANGAGKVGRRAPQRQRMCGDCEENVATLFCADCQPSLVLCDDCAVVLHRGATRRNHHLKGELLLLGVVCLMPCIKYCKLKNSLKIQFYTTHPLP